MGLLSWWKYWSIYLFIRDTMTVCEGTGEGAGEEIVVYIIYITIGITITKSSASTVHSAEQLFFFFFFFFCKYLRTDVAVYSTLNMLCFVDCFDHVED